MKTSSCLAKSTAAIVLMLLPGAAFSQTVRNFDNNNNVFEQAAGDLSVLDTIFNFLGGNDRLVLLRNDDLAGLGNGGADMGDGLDVVITSFNMSGTFNLVSGDDVFVSEGDVNFNGNATDILVNAGPGNDIIGVTTDFCIYRGDDGDDGFISNASRNNFDGGPGNDTYSAEAADSPVGIDLIQGLAVSGSATGDILTSIENARGSDFNDEILGDANANRIDGLGGDDLIAGAAGNDTIAGGPGSNTIFGNEGVDTLVVLGTITSKTRLSPTTISVSGSLDGVAFVHTATDFEQILDNDVLKSIEFFMGESSTNNAQQTVIPGSSLVERLNALTSGQPPDGDGGANVINGDGGANVLNGGAGNDDISGFSGNDILNGGGGDDSLAGGTGNDVLNGGPGSDRLAGGRGRDTFVFDSSFAGGADTITDYRVRDDTIRISRKLVRGLPSGALAAKSFKNTERGRVDRDDRIIYETATGKLFFDSNGSAPGGSVLIATLPIRLPMNASEIVIRNK